MFRLPSLPTLTPVRLIGCLVPFVVIMVLLLALMTPTNTGNPATDQSGAGDNTDSTPDMATANWVYVGVRSDGTLALVDDQDAEVVINLARLNWESAAFSPDHKYVAVLAEQHRDGIKDLYLYNIAGQDWTVATPYADAGVGISGFIWADTDFILYTQGEPDLQWLHSYDVASGQITKLFIVPGELVFADAAVAQLMLRRNLGSDTEANWEYILTSREGVEVTRFKAADLGEGYRLLEVFAGRSTSEFMLRAIQDTTVKLFTFSLDSLETNPLLVDAFVAGFNIYPLCAQGADLMFAYSVADAGKVLNVFTLNPDQEMYSKLDSLETENTFLVQRQRSFCHSNQLYLQVQEFIKEDVHTKWYTLEAEKLKQLTSLSGYSQVSVRP